MDFERPEPGLCEMKVRRCFFRDFFARHDAVLVTTVMCAFRRELDAGDRPFGQWAAGRAHLPALARETTSAGSRWSKPTIPSLADTLKQSVKGPG
jgi:hypothetical protein